jgi:hypothetical protein
LKRDENFFHKKSSEGVLKPIVEQKKYHARRTPPSSKNFVFRSHLLFKRRNIFLNGLKLTTNKNKLKMACLAASHL